MSNPKDTSDWLETQVKKFVREELAGGCHCNSADGTRTSVELNPGGLRLELNYGEGDVGANHAVDRAVLRLDVDRSSTSGNRLAGRLDDLSGPFFAPDRFVDLPTVVNLQVHVSSSPVRSEPGAGHTCCSAMTVQENTSAGAVSPSAPAQPRFVQLGASVYDRENDLFFVAVNAAVARLNVDELNNSPALADDYKWEDAK